MGTMIGSDFQRQGFTDRLDRIARGGANTTRHVYVGPSAETPVAARKGLRDIVPSSVRRRSFWGEIVMVPTAALLGMCAVLAGRVVAFHLVPSADAAEALGAPAWTVSYGALAIAAALALLARMVFRLRGNGRFRALFVGFAAMALFEAFVVARAPALFEVLYSQEHVAGVIARVSPGA